MQDFANISEVTDLFDTPLDWTSSECVLLDNGVTTTEEF
jgi:hypothetical protein